MGIEKPQQKGGKEWLQNAARAAALSMFVTLSPAAANAQESAANIPDARSEMIKKLPDYQEFKNLGTFTDEKGRKGARYESTFIGKEGAWVVEQTVLEDADGYFIPTHIRVIQQIELHGTPQAAQREIDQLRENIEKGEGAGLESKMPQSE